MDNSQRQDWISEKSRHVDRINSLLNRLEPMMDLLDPTCDDDQVDQDELLITAALQHYRAYWQQQMDEIAAM